MAGDDIRFSIEALDGLMADVRADEISRGIKSPRHPAADELWAYLNDTGSWLLTKRINRHLAACNVCASRVKAFKESCRAWEGSDGEARLRKFRDKIRRATQPELEFRPRFDGASAPNAYSTIEYITAAKKPLMAPEQMVRKLLYDTGSIQTGFDYGLPNGLHCGTQVNLGRICRSEDTLSSIVSVLDGLLREENFDTLVSTSWALATIARRLALRREDRGFRRTHHVTVEGYNPPCVLETVSRGARVVLLVDVVVTGGQIGTVTEELMRQNAASVKSVAIIDAEYPGRRVPGQYEALCHIPIDVAPPAQCPRCNVLPPAEFNPILGGPTKRKLQPRSPSEFLEQDPIARELWDFVDIAGAFEHHRKIGKRHYIGFIDTVRLLEHKTVGGTIVKKLCQKIFDRSGVPNTIVVPARANALLLGRRLVEGFERYFGNAGVRCVAVRRRSGHFAVDGLPNLSGQRVLVADAAAGHGGTLDELALLSSASARSIAGAVVLSRLSEACEETLNHRLSGGFTRLYSMPVRPFTVHDEKSTTCPFCLRRQDLDKAVGELPAGPLKELAKKLADRTRHSRRIEKASGGERQLALLPLSPFVTFRPGVGSGIALHALYAAMGDGMAPLSLPEISSQDISAAQRAALVADLPPAALRSNGSPLEKEFCEFLRKGTDKKVWMAVFQAMSRAGSTAWVDPLRDAMANAKRCGDWMDHDFWLRIMLSVYGMTRGKPEVSEELRRPLEDLVQTGESEGPAREALRAVLDATSQQREVYEVR